MRAYLCRLEADQSHRLWRWLLPGKIWTPFSKGEIDALMSKCQPFVQDLYNSGHLIMDAGLSVETTSIRTVKGKMMTTDGPFAETKEQIGSAFLIEAQDLNEAIRVASKHPAARMGEQFGWRVELRPVTVFERR